MTPCSPVTQDTVYMTGQLPSRLRLLHHQLGIVGLSSLCVYVGVMCLLLLASLGLTSSSRNSNGLPQRNKWSLDVFSGIAFQTAAAFTFTFNIAQYDERIDPTEGWYMACLLYTSPSPRDS